MKKILVIEDNDTNLYLIKYILKHHGFEVIEAKDGVSGVETAAREIPDLILMDIQLPVIDGYEATRRIREHEATKDIPILAITSFALTGDREKVFAAGCNGYLEKPINPETIIEEISKFL